MSSTGGSGHWLRFEIGGARYGLPVDTVAQVIGLSTLQACDVPGWIGLLPMRDGTLPVADGAVLVGSECGPARGRGLVLRGRMPLGVAVDSVLGLSSAVACPLVARIGLPELTTAAIPAADGPTLVLDPDALWRRIWAGLEALPAGAGFALKPLCQSPGKESPPEVGARSEGRRPPAAADGMGRRDQPPTPAGGTVNGHQPRAETNGTQAAPAPKAPIKVLVFGAGLEVALAVPAEQVLEVGPECAARPLPGGPKHLAGMLQWRGRLVPLVDLPTRLGSSLAEPRRTLYLAVTGRAARALAIRVGDVLGQAMVPPPNGPLPDLGLPIGWVRAVAQIGGRPLAVLEPAALLAA